MKKGGERHEVPCHPTLEEYLNPWITAGGISRDKKGPLFRTMSRGDKLADRPMSRFDVLHMIKHRAEAGALRYSTCCHTFRATGITTYLQNGGNLEHAQAIRQSRIAANDEVIRPNPRRTLFRGGGADKNLSEHGSFVCYPGTLPTSPTCDLTPTAEYCLLAPNSKGE